MDDLLRQIHPNARKTFERIGARSHHGINISLMSIHTNDSCGIGEFNDLYQLIDWCTEIGFSVIQLLPLNDSGFDPSPYNALSSCALNPIFLSIRDLPDLPTAIEGQLKELLQYSKTEKVAYQEVLKKKLKLLFHYYTATYELIKQTPSYQRFIEKHTWLIPYAVFKVLNDENNYKSWGKWNQHIQSPSHSTLKKLYQEKQQQADFYIYLQYLCFYQLYQVSQYAKKMGIFLKGDIPILISTQSSDVWYQRHFFRLDKAAGAPPDVFNPDGQYWGFPLFKWKVIEEDDFGWWKTRLQYAENFYDIYRIDHIIGFFRIWSIPRDQPALKGSFEPKEEWEYLAQGELALTKMLEATHMLPIGEDLGIIPDKVHAKLQEIGICSTKVPRWEKDYHGDGHIIPYSEYPKLSLTTVSTHDSETLALWWEHYKDEVKAFCMTNNIPYEKNITPEIKKELIYQSHKTPSLFHINLLGEYLSAFPDFGWADPKLERINVPGFILPSNWVYKTKTKLEEIVEHEGLRQFMRECSC